MERSIVPEASGQVQEPEVCHPGPMDRASRDWTDDPAASAPAEFAGWLPVFQKFGNGGLHLQFGHTDSPPGGDKFVRAGPPEQTAPAAPSLRQKLNAGIGRTVRGFLFLVRLHLALVKHAIQQGPTRSGKVLWAALRLFFTLLWGGARLVPVLRFLHSRDFASQVQLPRRSGLVFLTSVPYTYGQDPWVIEIEDSISLFNPFLHNGQTSKLKIADFPYRPILRKLLEADNCRGIITHVRSTAESLPTLFDSEIIGEKTSYLPLGVKLPEHWQQHQDEEYLDLVFTCSWHQYPESFYLRGGLEVLDAFDVLREWYPQLRLTLRTGLPRLSNRYHRILEKGWVRIVNRYLPPKEMDALLRKSHVFLLPAARIHVVSLLRAMAFGQVVVASDGWGIEEYIAHERNGLIVKGRYGKVSWMDEKTGLLREDYRPMHRSDLVVVQGLVEAISRVAEDRNLRRRLGRQARRDVETTYSLENWNRGLQAALDKARGMT